MNPTIEQTESERIDSQLAVTTSEAVKQFVARLRPALDGPQAAAVRVAIAEAFGLASRNLDERQVGTVLHSLLNNLPAL
ncbi:MAG TPA: hypothetical protein VL175_15095 [Pirellulales bacterium]|nr:hypothetical protein [Pirellulales bacterium]